MEKIFRACITTNTGRISGYFEHPLGYYRFPVNAWHAILKYIDEHDIDGFVDGYQKDHVYIQKDPYTFTVGDLISEISTGLVTSAIINGVDYRFYVEEIKIED